MALNFSSVSTSINEINNQRLNAINDLKSVTTSITNGATRAALLASSVGEVRRGSDTASSTLNDIEQRNTRSVNQITQLSDQIQSNANSLLSSGIDEGVALDIAVNQAVIDTDRISNDDNSRVAPPQASSNASSNSDDTFSPNEVAELFQPTPGTFDPSTDVDLGAVIDIFPFLFEFSKPPIVPDNESSGQSRSKVPNPLRDYNNYNYIITLGLLSPDEYNDPTVYRSNGNFSKYITKSAGGDYADRYKTNDEVDYSGDAEYYLEDLEIDAVIAPNPNTSVAMGTSVRFQIIEPLSMGNFIQALVGIAKEQGYPNVLQSPFCLKIDFVGWDEAGTSNYNYTASPIFIPINIINMDFNVSGQGSVYDVQAIAYSEAGLSDSVNTTQTTINANGSAVWQVLHGEDRSVTSALNQRISRLEDEDVITSGDRYIIAFPDSLNGMQESIRGSLLGAADPVTSSEFLQQQRGLSEPPSADVNIDESLQEVRVPPNSDVEEVINAYARDINRMNEIGKSLFVENISDAGDHATGNYNASYDDETNTISQDGVDLSVSEKAREHKFSQGEKVSQIIEKVILRSQYAAEKSSEESDENGTREWFKIETRVYITQVGESTAEIGRPSRLYVYSVIPYYSDEAKYLATNEKGKNTQGLKDFSAKEYNYIYTGINEDVLEFNLSFNQAFLQTAMSNYGNTTTDGTADRSHAETPDHKLVLNKRPNSSSNVEPGALNEEMPDLNIPASGTRSSDPKLRIAQMFHNRLVNQVTDLITAEMKIFGDPYFLPQQTGNHFGTEEPDNPLITQDGTMNYMQNEVFIVVNFKTPFDYQIDGATMEFPKNVPQFSGLFSCWAVTNTFSQGKFEQTLKLIRRRGQDDEPTSGNLGAVKTDNMSSAADDAE